MIKRTVLFLLILSLMCYFVGCNSYTPKQNLPESSDPVADATEVLLIEQNDSDYMIQTNWMKFCFSKNDFTEAEVSVIAGEAARVMADIRGYLCVSYTTREAEGAICYFDFDYRNDDGQQRSQCFWNERKIYCVSLTDFVHEYTHMISESNHDLVYHPGKIFSEGLAEYVSLNFYDGIASETYDYFKAEAVSENANASEHQTICELLSQNKLPYSAKNYNKAFVVLFNKNYDISKIDTNSDFYRYYIGYVFVEYCIEQLGGIEKFMSVYCDSVTVADVYNKPTDELVADACDHNMSAFCQSGS